jgi:hypothetical protein
MELNSRFQNDFGCEEAYVGGIPNPLGPFTRRSEKSLIVAQAVARSLGWQLK